MQTSNVLFAYIFKSAFVLYQIQKCGKSKQRKIKIQKEKKVSKDKIISRGERHGHRCPKCCPIRRRHGSTRHRSSRNTERPSGRRDSEAYYQKRSGNCHL